MIPRLRFGVLLAVLFVSMRAWPASQVPSSAPPPGAQAAAAAGTGLIVGQVIDATTGQPVPEAQVTITLSSGRAGGRGALPAVVADSQGRFFFRNLAPATYALLAIKNGYTPRRATFVELGDGERFLEARVGVRKLANVTGGVRDTAGDPVVGTEILPFRRTLQNGQPVFQAVLRGVKTDDRGLFRLSGLPDGDYFICACLRDPNPFDPVLLTTLASQPMNLMSVAARALNVGADVVSLDGSLRGYAPTFYPNSLSMARATRVTVAPGEDKSGIDIVAELVPATRVSGRVIGQQNAVNSVSIRLVPAADADAGIQLTSIQPMLVQPDGRFDFASVPPGQYRLTVAHRELGQTTGAPTGLALGFAGSRAAAPPPAPVPIAGPGVTPPPILWANELITVGEDGLTGLVISLNQPISITGRVQFVGSAPQPTEQMLTRSTVVLNWTTTTGGLLIPAGGSIAANGTFRLTGAVPGKYTVQSTTVAGYSTLKSVTLAGVDITDMPIEVGQKDLSDLVLTYVDTPMASLTVTVPVQQANRLNDDVVLVYPVDRKFWADTTAARRRFRSGLISSKGTATITDLPGGEYFVLVDSNPESAESQESVLDSLARRAQRVVLGDGEKRTIEVRR